MKKIKTIIVSHSLDENGKNIVRVPLVNSDDTAILYEPDWNDLLSIGLSPAWRLSPSGEVVARVPSQAQSIGVARVIKDAGKGETVHYLNSKNDLRRNFLILAKGNGQFRARDKVAQAHQILPQYMRIFADGGYAGKKMALVVWQTQRIDQDVPLATLDLLARVVARRIEPSPPF